MIDWDPFFHIRALLESRICHLCKFVAAGKMPLSRFSAYCHARQPVLYRHP
jgi:hypothetical protein